MLLIFFPTGILAGVTTTIYPLLMPLVLPPVTVTSCKLLALAPAFTVQPFGTDEMVDCFTTGRHLRGI